jgi:aminoglycoside phosphotransferase (APT) family kinase protein
VKLSTPPAPALEREAQVLSFLSASAPGFDVPNVVGFSRDHGALALKWESGAPSLQALQERGRKLTTGDARRLGVALASLHALEPDPEIPSDASAELVRNLTWPTVAWYATLNPAMLQFLSAVQSADGAFSALVQMTEAAVDPPRRCLVHGDFRLPNLLLRRGRWLFVDWELAAISDPAVDVGSAIAEVLGGMIAGRSVRERVSHRAACAWTKSFFAGYRAASTEDPTLDERALRWAGEALLRRVYSLAHYEGTFDDHSRDLIDSALELLIRPRAWRGDFLGAKR